MKEQNQILISILEHTRAVLGPANIVISIGQLNNVASQYNKKFFLTYTGNEFRKSVKSSSEENHFTNIYI